MAQSLGGFAMLGQFAKGIENTPTDATDFAPSIFAGVLSLC